MTTFLVCLLVLVWGGIVPLIFLVLNLRTRVRRLETEQAWTAKVVEEHARRLRPSAPCHWCGQWHSCVAYGCAIVRQQPASRELTE